MKNYDNEMDYILLELVEEYDELYKGVGFFSEDLPASTKDKISKKTMEKFGIKEWELNVMFYTLLIDKYLKSVDPLIISLEGLVFVNNGGYVQKQLNIRKEEEKLATIQKNLNRYSYGLMIFTAIVAFGTLISAWYFAIEVYRYYFE